MKARKTRISLWIAIMFPLATIGMVLAWQTAAALRCSYTYFAYNCARSGSCWPVEMQTSYQCYTGIGGCCYCETVEITCANGEIVYDDLQKKLRDKICNPERTNRMPCEDPAVLPPGG